jgi:hypothetical protein
MVSTWRLSFLLTQGKWAWQKIKEQNTNKFGKQNIKCMLKEKVWMENDLRLKKTKCNMKNQGKAATKLQFLFLYM